MSSVSITEIAIKSGLGKLGMSALDVRSALEDLLVGILPFAAEHAFRLFDFPAHHRDPFDRQIIAQALSEDIPVITPDPQFRLYEGLRIVW